MAIPLPVPKIGDSESQQNFERLAGMFPLGASAFQDGSVGTVALAPGAATKLYTTTASTSSGTTTSTADPLTAVVPEMTITADFGGNPIVCVFSGNLRNSNAATAVEWALYDGTTEITRRSMTQNTAGGNNSCGLTHAYTPASGSRTVEIRWRVSANTGTAPLLQRQFSIIELRR